MAVPDRIAMCTADGWAGGDYIPLKPGESLPDTCFMDCDCTPVEFVRAGSDQRCDTGALDTGITPDPKEADRG
jgi:hypothetical protein